MLDNFKSTKTYKIIDGVAKSAIVALALSFVFFAYDVYKDSDQDKRDQEHFEKTVQQLDEVRQALSTRFLGSFPMYLPEINTIVERIQPQDTLIIFEDVLYYGIKSKPYEFRRFNQLLLNHTKHGGKVIVAYYDNHPDIDFPWNSIFYRTILESRISMKYVPQIMSEHRNRSRLASKEGQQEELDDWSLDSCITEKFFRITCNDDKKFAQKVQEGYISHAIVQNLINQNETDEIVNHLCIQLDSIMQMYLGGKKVDDIHFSDYKHMYSDMTDCIAECYRQNGVELIPLNEYLTMSCWLVKPVNESRSTEAILAFPSKYSSDEIGFYSQDASFSHYISMILNGVNGNMADMQGRSNKAKD